MLIKEWEKTICEIYLEADEKGQRHCHECPLRLPHIEPVYACMDNCHWDKKRKEWIID